MSDLLITRYNELVSDREPFLTEARRAARYTIRTLIAPDTRIKNRKFIQPYQGLGAKGVNNLSSKLLLLLMPPNQPFFRQKPNQRLLDEAVEKEGNPELISKIEEQLSKREGYIMDEIEETSDRVALPEALKHLFVAGNVLFYDHPTKGLKYFPLTNYVVYRDPMGSLLEVIVKETVALNSLPDDIRIQIPEDNKDQKEKDVDIYTGCKLKGNEWVIFQEIKGVKLKETEGFYPEDKSPFLPLRFTRIDGENYGRGYVEDLLGDLILLENLRKALAQAALAAAKFIFFVKPQSSTRARDVKNAENGEFVVGNAEDITTLQVQKYYDLGTAQKEIDRIELSLKESFLLFSPRNAERVTTEEIRQTIKQIEESFGGFYSILAKEFQLPYIKVKIYHLERAKKIGKLPKNSVRTSIITGLEGLGRGNDLNKLTLLRDILAPFGEAALSRVIMGDFITRAATAIGINPNGLVKSEEQITQEQQQAAQAQQMAAIGQKAAPDMMKQVTGHILDQANNNKGDPNGSTNS